jgi:hypothetical protein
MKIVLLSALTLISIIAKSQTTLKANDAGIKYDLIHPGHTTSIAMAFDSLGQKVQEYTSDNFVIVDKKTGEIALIRSSTDESTHTFYTDTSFILMSPVRMHSAERPAHKELKVTFERASVNVKSIIDGVSKNENYSMNEGYFDDNVLVDIMGYFPIKKGEKYYMEGFRYESVKTKGVSAYLVEYLHDDYLFNAKNEPVFCKVIYYKNDYCYGYAWYDKSSCKPLKLLIYLKKNSYLVNFN